MSYAYPHALKTVLKCAPVCIIFTTFGTVWPTILYNMLNHPHEHIQKYHFRSSKFERMIRTRD